MRHSVARGRPSPTPPPPIPSPPRATERAAALHALRRAAARLAAPAVPPISVLDCLARWDPRPSVVLDDRLHPALRGGCDLVDGRWLIILNREDALAQARFTLAHELGHIVLGDLDGVAPPGDAREREALCDHFAAELLLPAAALRAASRRAGPAALAARFQVPPAVLRRRLAELGLTEPRPAGAAPV